MPNFSIDYYCLMASCICYSSQHANLVMWAMTGGAVRLVAVPFKFVLMGLTMYFFMANSKAGKSMSSAHGDRRLREWWESIPIIPVRIVSRPS